MADLVCCVTLKAVSPLSRLWHLATLCTRGPANACEFRQWDNKMWKAEVSLCPWSKTTNVKLLTVSILQQCWKHLLKMVSNLQQRLTKVHFRPLDYTVQVIAQWWTFPQIIGPKRGVFCYVFVLSPHPQAKQLLVTLSMQCILTPSSKTLFYAMC